MRAKIIQCPQCEHNVVEDVFQNVQKCAKCGVCFESVEEINTESIYKVTFKKFHEVGKQ